jgi:hypothetical protein
MPRKVIIEDGKKQCPRCGHWKTLEDEYNKSERSWYGYQTTCRDCDHQKQRATRVKYVEKQLLKSAGRRARDYDVPFNITLEDIVIPDACPVFRTAMYMGTKGDNRNSPSIDRIIPELGYVPGNIQVISMKANTMKQDASPDELEQFAWWILGSPVKERH